MHTQSSIYIYDCPTNQWNTKYKTKNKCATQYKYI